MSSGEARLRATLRRLGARRSARPPLRLRGDSPLNVSPTNAFEVAVAERLKALEAEVDRLRSRLDWLLVFIVGAAITNVVISLLKP